MIKFILSDQEQHSYKYNDRLSIKEILNGFCKERGLLPDIYEAYDPIKCRILDCNKKLIEYNLTSLHLRRIDSNVSSIQDSQEKFQSINTNDKLWNETSIQAYSQNSFKQINEDNFSKKNKKGLIHKLKKKFKSKKQNLTRSYSENLESPVDNQIMTLSTDEISHDSKKFDSINSEMALNAKSANKKKRLAPLPPVKNVITLSCENDDSKTKSIELEIPPPPPDSKNFTENYNLYPWQSSVECHTENDSFEEDSIYSFIPEKNAPLPVSEFRIIEPPKCPSPQDFSDDDIESPNYIYSQIQKKVVDSNILDRSIETINISSHQSDLPKNTNWLDGTNEQEFHKSDSSMSDSVHKLSLSINNVPNKSSESETSSISSKSDVSDENYSKIKSKYPISTKTNHVSLKIPTSESLETKSDKPPLITKSNLSEKELSQNCSVSSDAKYSSSITDQLTSNKNVTIDENPNLTETNHVSLKIPTSESLETKSGKPPLITKSNLSEKELSQNCSVSSDAKYSYSKTDQLTSNKNVTIDEKPNLTASNKCVKPNSPKLPSKPIIKYQIRNKDSQVNELSNILDSSSTSKKSVDRPILVQKQGKSFYFSAKDH